MRRFEVPSLGPRAGEPASVDRPISRYVAAVLSGSTRGVSVPTREMSRDSAAETKLEAAARTALRLCRDRERSQDQRCRCEGYDLSHAKNLGDPRQREPEDTGSAQALDGRAMPDDSASRAAVWRAHAGGGFTHSYQPSR